VGNTGLQMFGLTMTMEIEILAETLGYLQYSTSFIPKGRSFTLPILTSIVTYRPTARQRLDKYLPEERDSW
jgi:hypothetical protein